MNVTPTPTDPNHDVREAWAARLQCADVGVDFPWLTEDGCDVWHEQPVATQEHYRRLLDLALSAGLQIPPLAAVSAAAPESPEDPCASCGKPRREHRSGYSAYRCAFRAAAAPDEREALSGEGLPERFRFSRTVYGDVADDATRVLLALTDGGHADQPSDYLRWVSIRAAQALAARPAPAVNAADVEYAIDGAIPDDLYGYRERYTRHAASRVLALLRHGDADHPSGRLTVADEGAER